MLGCLRCLGYHHSSGISGAGADDILISTYEKPASSLHGNDSSIAMNCHQITTDATYNPWYGRAVRALTQTTVSCHENPAHDCKDNARSVPEGQTPRAQRPNRTESDYSVSFDYLLSDSERRRGLRISNPGVQTQEVDIRDALGLQCGQQLSHFVGTRQGKDPHV